jgi:cell wall-associated NlpC family hydrolase
VELLIQYALSFVGKEYRWGGDDPIHGWDCSGLVQELLASVGMDPPGDQTAQALFDHFEKVSEWNRYGAGALVFYGKSVREITHVAMMVDSYRIIEAGGGGSATVSSEVAARQNAYVRIRHISRRKDIVALLRPRYSTIGLV